MNFSINNYGCWTVYRQVEAQITENCTVLGNNHITVVYTVI